MPLKGSTRSWESVRRFGPASEVDQEKIEDVLARLFRVAYGTVDRRAKSYALTARDGRGSGARHGVGNPDRGDRENPSGIVGGVVVL